MSHQNSRHPKNLFRIESHMIRPIIYQVFTRYITLLFFSLLWDFFLNKGSIHRPVSTAFVLCAIFLAVMAWLAYLRLDGIRAPRFDRRLFRWKKKPARSYGDIIDYIDEDIPTFDDLDDEDKDRCLFLSNLITAVLFILTAVIRPV